MRDTGPPPGPVTTAAASTATPGPAPKPLRSLRDDMSSALFGIIRSARQDEIAAAAAAAAASAAAANDGRGRGSSVPQEPQVLEGRIAWPRNASFTSTTQTAAPLGPAAAAESPGPPVRVMEGAKRSIGTESDAGSGSVRTGGLDGGARRAAPVPAHCGSTSFAKGPGSAAAAAAASAAAAATADNDHVFDGNLSDSGHGIVAASDRLSVTESLNMTQSVSATPSVQDARLPGTKRRRDSGVAGRSSGIRPGGSAAAAAVSAGVVRPKLHRAPFNVRQEVSMPF